MIETERIDETAPAPGSGGDADRARALAEEAEAEAAEAEAIAAAARARARALRLRREAEETVQASPANGLSEGATQGATINGATEVADADGATEVADADGATEAASSEGATEVADADGATEVADADGATEVADSGDTVEAVGGDLDAARDGGVDVEDEATPARRRRRLRLPRPTWRGIVAALVILVTAALLALSGYMIWEHREAERLRQLDAEYSAAARQSVVTLMSLNFNNAEEDVQRIIDNSTGQFKDDFESQAQDFVQVAQDSKVVTEVSVNATGVESMTEDTAVVLVAASSRVTNSGGANQEPRTWRLSVHLQREGEQLKMSKVEFVP
ncbi:VirB8 protein [Mycobacterium sp. PO1]|nr:VirB8 protein [Mycobacterium sp. PO1]GFM22530.1 VirB8 protein [Mycobacterium sp. PO2]